LYAPSRNLRLLKFFQVLIYLELPLTPKGNGNGKEKSNYFMQKLQIFYDFTSGFVIF